MAADRAIRISLSRRQAPERNIWASLNPEAFWSCCPLTEKDDKARFPALSLALFIHRKTINTINETFSWCSLFLRRRLVTADATDFDTNMLKHLPSAETQDHHLLIYANSITDYQNALALPQHITNPPSPHSEDSISLHWK